MPFPLPQSFIPPLNLESQVKSECEGHGDHDDEVCVEMGKSHEVKTKSTPLLVEAYEDKEAMTADDLQRHLTLRQLKDKCNELGIGSVGKKDELAKRISEVYSKE